MRAFAAEIAATAARVPDRTVSTIFFGGGTPSLMQPATVAAILDAIAKHWRVAPDVEVTPRSQSDQRRSRPASAATAPPASTASRSACRRSTIACWPSLAACTRRAKRSMRSVSRAAIFDRYSFDLIYARPRPGPEGLGGRADPGASRSRRSPLALSTDHRAGHAVRRAPCGGQARHSRRRSRPRALRHDPGDLRRRTACRPTRFPTTPGPAANAGTIWSTGAPTNTPASGLALTAGSISTATGMRPRRKNGRNPGSCASRRPAMASPPTTR